MYVEPFLHYYDEAHFIIDVILSYLQIFLWVFFIHVYKGNWFAIFFVVFYVI